MFDVLSTGRKENEEDEDEDEEEEEEEQIEKRAKG